MEWENLDDFLFANPLEFDEDKAQTNTPFAPTSLGRKNGESPQSGTGGNDIRFAD